MNNGYPCYNNLNETPFCFEYIGLKFYFSSEYKKSKFKNKCKDFIENETLKLKARYNVNIDLTYNLLVSFYKKCETRGFRVEYNNKKLKDNFNFMRLYYGKK